MSERPSKLAARITVGIVTYNSAAVIGETLKSLSDAHGGDESVAIILWDNMSTDETVSIVCGIAEGAARMQVVEGADNPGFGIAHNRILTRVESEFHVICNPDILVSHKAIENCVEFLEQNPQIGLVSPRMTYRDGSHQRSTRRNPTVLDLALRRLVPARLRSIFARRIDYYEMADLGYEAPFDVPFATGSFMVCRTSALRAVGGFDERYFLYFEDADLSRSLQRAGWRTVYFPGATVVHGWERSAHKNLRMAFVLLQNGIRYFNKWGWKFR